ncbi:substrate-binding domain-containing protein [Ileibacterium valens]|uniref:substrate-binding domain-containing protein n=1 Tax=Ileibacterium valens TaxID=1862668 RepID=UPI0027295D45|nr:substrate-binding domain-containing protein [Ileibacterium valens]
MKFMKNLMGVCLGAALFAAAGCAPSAPAADTNADEGQSNGNEIGVMTREDGSGTRSAFVELFGIEEKQEDGSKKDLTIPTAAVTNSTSVMMTNVSNDPAAIGYISLGSMNDTVKGLKIDGAKPTAENVENGSYKISRPFNLIVKEQLSDAADDFVAFIMSDDGQKIVEEEGYIPVDGTGAYEKKAEFGKVVVSGSSSVTPLMEKLSEAYQTANPGVSVEVQQSDSSTGITDAADGISDIGMASRDLKDEEKDLGVTSKVIANDGIVVIVNQNNAADELSSDAVRKIYTGEITTWDEAAG